MQLDTVFYLILAGGQKPVKVELVDQAFRIYKTPKTPAHASIRAWADGWSTFGASQFSTATFTPNPSTRPPFPNRTKLSPLKRRYFKAQPRSFGQNLKPFWFQDRISLRS
ncbi:hypothetical protein GALMADRAFT_777069 [Galerina marginata CBS 339.88]|uniref:Uncharacterized protein n=1 Tax=Galerina marginata (strain CBS 339.88) TaxID=685588 RepID=A0A067SY75_GALM3|nr:hypothetical protein GALMADRAFT_777069 [Galerina marginata CBS 339.88]